MRSVSQKAKRSKKQKRLGEPQVVGIEEFEELEVDVRLEMIRALIPLGLSHIERELQREVEELAGVRYARKAPEQGARRHGHNRGSVRLGGQRHAIRVPRVRDEGGEVALESYQTFHNQDGRGDDTLFRRVLLGISTRNYEAAAESVAGAIGLSSSTVSRQFIQESAKKLKVLQERDLSEDDYVTVILDGKTFGDDQMVTALGITMDGKKRVLGFTQCASENRKAVVQFLRRLVDRGLGVAEGLLFVIDGSKGLGSAIREIYRQHGRAPDIQRCQWHYAEFEIMPMWQWQVAPQAEFRLVMSA